MESIDKRLYNPNFRFREAEIARIHHCLERGESVLLTGIRRTGKTQVLKAALYRLAQTGAPVAFLDVQDRSDLATFYQDLLNVLMKEIPPKLREKLIKGLSNLPSGLMKWLGKYVKEVKVLESGLSFQQTEDQLIRYWQPLVEELSLFLANHKDTKRSLPVIGIDELPFMLENMLRAGIEPKVLTVMLASLRKLRDSGLRMIIAGSISFENLLTLHKIPHTVIGGLGRHAIVPFTRSEAHSYLTENLERVFAGRAEVLALALDNLTDYIPEFLNIAISGLSICTDLDGCQTCLHETILPQIRRSFLQQFEERLERNYGADELESVNLILDIIAKADEQGTPLNNILLPVGYRGALLKLQYDNFLIEGSDFNWCFSLRLIRLWWRGNRGMV